MLGYIPINQFVAEQAQQWKGQQLVLIGALVWLAWEVISRNG